GKAGEQEAALYELGPVATLARPDVAAAHTSAGANHGFDTTFATLKSGSQPVCLYAVGINPESETLLGCRTIDVPVAIALRHLKSIRNGIRLRVRCEWPAGTACPGQILLRARVRVRVARRGRRGPKTRVITVAIARRGFTLTGEQSHAFRVALSTRGRLLTAGRSTLRAQLTVAIPGGHVTRAMTLRIHP
ncbi:MAG: hypothetical protein WBM00_05540, partial [Solirubrobacterales bacterium]